MGHDETGDLTLFFKSSTIIIQEEEEGGNAIDDNEREDEEEDNNKDVEDDNNEGPKEQGERKTSTKELNPNAPPSPEQINKFCNNILRFQHNKDFTIFKNVIAF